MENKEFENIHPYTTIETIDEKYSLCCLIDEKGKYVTDMCWLELHNTKNGFNCWDNSDFIWKELYNTVKSYIVDKQVTIDFEDIMQDIPVEDFKYVYELLEFGIKLGFRKDE